MNKKEIAEKLREEVGHLELSIKKTLERCEQLKRFVLELEAEIEAAEGKQKPSAEPPGPLRKIVDSVFGEEPKRKR
jgi:hypothetical protein